MKVKIKLGYVDKNGVHNKGEVLDINEKHFDPFTMTKIDEPTKAEEIPSENPKATPKKRTSKK